MKNKSFNAKRAIASFDTDAQLRPRPWRIRPSARHCGASGSTVKNAGTMNRLRWYLVMSWMATAAVLLVLWLVDHRSRVSWLVAGGIAFLAQRTLMPTISAETPTPGEFFAERPWAKPALLLYGFVLAVLALWLLTAGQKYGRELEDYLPLIFTVILAPFIGVLVLHQVCIFQMAGGAD
jgi:hypothetical protein